VVVGDAEGTGEAVLAAAVGRAVVLAGVADGVGELIVTGELHAESSPTRTSSRKVLFIIPNERRPAGSAARLR
jgi:hypothetical protein